ncbi:hypothetical protein QCA50_001725 [Cerrena zonata]|uniref:DNA-binding protein RAP1 n=1 Tax=Cerrena zonata TaxID=2478898 RepID=A0AAW0GXV2_9APHY
MQAEPKKLLFQDDNQAPIKFFIQKDIPEQTQAELCEAIAAEGGRVEGKVPRAGYILIQHGTPEAGRLQMCWQVQDRPERFFVPYTWVNACKTHNLLLKQIFISNGEPIRMHIDSSIANINARALLSNRILHSGGDPTASAQSARVILADPNTEVFQHLVKTYQGEPDKYVESYLWVKKCQERGVLNYTPVVYKNPGGRRPGEERTQFTEEDEEHLCNWIAAKIPYKETGGRTGNRLYQQLCEMSQDSEYSWVTRHTWQSWRERYKKNAPRLDVRIAQIVQEKKPAMGEKGQYGYVRKPEEKPKRTRRKKNPAPEANGDEPVAGPSTTNDTEEPPITLPMPMAPPPPPPGMTISDGPPNYSAVLYSAPPPFSQLSAGPSMDSTTARQNAQEQEMEDGEEETQWPIRIADAPPPAWAMKRPLDAEESGNPAKKLRLNGSEPEEQPPAASPVLHVVDQGIQDTAREFRFTIEEVREYYDKCGDMERTRNRFKKMREVLLALPDDEPSTAA